MNGYECDGTYIFMRCKIECSIQRCEAKFKNKFHLSPNYNICTIARMKDNHFLFYMISKIYLSFRTQNKPSYTGKHNSIFDRAVSGQRSPQCTIARYYLTIVEWCIYFISRDPGSSIQMTRIYIGVI